MASRNDKKKDKDKTLSLGIFILSISLIILSLYLLTKSRSGVNAVKQVSFRGDTTFTKSSEKTYTDEKYGYSVTYPSILQPRTLNQEGFLSVVIFFVPENVPGEGFAISVEESSLDSAVEKVKDAVKSETEIAEVSQNAVEISGFKGIKLIVEPEDLVQYEKKTIVMVNNGKFTYGLNSSPDVIDKLVANFKLLK